MATAVASKVPAITADIEQAKRDIGEHGVAILSGVLSPEEHARLRDAVYAEAEADRRTGRADDPYFADDMLGNPSQRVWNLPSRQQMFCDLAVHPVVMEMVRSVVDGGIRLSTFSANITLPGSYDLLAAFVGGWTIDMQVQPAAKTSCPQCLSCCRLHGHQVKVFLELEGEGAWRPASSAVAARHTTSFSQVGSITLAT